MEHRKLSLISKLDNGLVKGLCIMLGWLKYLGLWLLGVFLLLASFSKIFEYSEGLADISDLSPKFRTTGSMRFLTLRRSSSVLNWRQVVQ